MKIFTPHQEKIFDTAYRLGVMDTEKAVARRLIAAGGTVSAVAYLLDTAADYVQQYLTEEKAQ